MSTTVTLEVFKSKICNTKGMIVPGKLQQKQTRVRCNTFVFWHTRDRFVILTFVCGEE